ncbi:MAG: glycosyltransferase family 4 protein [Candidatus Binatia bacterium]
MADRKNPLTILAVAPLPFYQNGVKTFHFGGSIFYAELLPGLARQGHTVRVIAETPATNAGETRTGLDWTIPQLEVEWSALEYRSGSTPPPATYYEAARKQMAAVFTRFVKQQRPDIVIIGRETVANPVLSLCKEYRLPALLIAHGSPTWSLLHGAYPEAPKQQLIDAFRQVDGIVAIAQHLVDILQKLGVTRVDLIPNIADPIRFHPEPKDHRLLQELIIAPEQIVVGYFSTLKPRKRPLDLIVAAEKALKTQPRIVYVIGGVGSCREEMLELGRRLGIADRFRYVGEIDYQRMPQYLNLADIVVLPSEREGAPLVYRETQACGRVLLASDIPAAREAIVDGETGLLFRLGDTEDLAAKIVALAENRELRQMIGQKARAATAQQTLDRWIEAYEEVSRRVVLHTTPVERKT